MSNERYLAMCSGKQRYASWNEASDVLGYRKKRKRRSHTGSAHGDEMKPYRCRYCQGWHVGRDRR